MENIMQLITNFQPIIMVLLIVLVIVLTLLVIIQFKMINRVEKRYRKFMRGTDNKNIEELINLYLQNVDKALEETQGIKDLYNSLNEKLDTCIQKVAIMRYRAFEDVGSDLSYSIALLDGKNNGIVITGIYGRNESTTYSKPIDKGISRYELSDEEKYVLTEAINKSE